MKKKKYSKGLTENIEIYLDFKNDLILIANKVNDLVVYSIQNDNILQTNIKKMDIFQDLITKGNWKKISTF
jgi:sulfur transfer complex TusBCD TusB component (DsrH family)